MKFLSVFAKQFIRKIRHLALCLCRLCRMCNTKSKHHLAFPERDCVDQCRLDLFCHHCIVILHQTDLRCCLKGNHSGKFQIMKLLFESGTFAVQIFCRLCIFRKPSYLCFLFQFFKLSVPHSGKA